jgi:hypothetical protein
MRLNTSALRSRLLLAAALACACAGAAPAQQAGRIDINALTEETQKTLPDPDRMTLVWWIPEQFWHATLAQDPTTSKAQADAFIRTVSPYVMFVVVDGKIGAFGGVTYKTEDAIRGAIQVVDARGVAHRPLGREKIDADTLNLLMAMKPILASMMGRMGENMHFVLFPAKDAAGRRLADPAQEGALALKLGENSFRWKLPLGSVLPPKTCPVDGERMSGAWKFCPWHGEKLAPGADK